MLNRHRSQFGLTLVELLVALVASLVVIAGATSIYLASIRLENDNVNLARLTQDMRSLLDVMVRDIRRAGFASSDPVGNRSYLNSNPFFGSAIDGLPEGGDDCIVYTYNRDDSNENPLVVESDEYFGFRLNTEDDRVEMSQGGATNADCTNGDWVALSSPKIKVKELNFSLASRPELSRVNVTSMLPNADGVVVGDACLPSSTNCEAGRVGNGFCDAGEVCTKCVSGESCLQVQTVTIRLTAEVAAVPGLTQTITHQVRIRNDKFVDNFIEDLP